MEKITDIEAIIQQALQQQEPIIIAIDGPATSGKTTLAESLKEKFLITVVSMDDFFLPMNRKTPERLAEVGGNVDYERVEQQIFKPFKRQELAQYEAFDCQTKSYEQRLCTKSNVLVLEGVYALHPVLQKYVDYALLLEISAPEQLARLIKRNTPEMVDKYKNEWIPLENNYFTYLHQNGGI
ncbi:MAG: hypothetical protein ABS942_09350 [Solibacillus sp.]